MVKLDEINTLEVVERNNTLQRVTRVAIVTGLTANSYEVMLEGLDEVGVPNYGDHLDPIPDRAAFQLIVNERRVNMVDKHTAHVTLTYENAYNIDSVEDSFDNPHMGLVSGEVRCNVQQKSSNLDINGNQVVLSHTYPANDPNFPGQTREQGGEFTYYVAQRSFSVHGIKATNAPWAVANSINGRVNFLPFSGEAARTWLCVGANWRPESNGRHIDGIARYYMRFEFQFDSDTWDATVVYIDDITGRPPANLVPGTGIKTIQKIQAVNFENILGTLIHGA